MHDATELLGLLWADYAQINPQAQGIYDLLAGRNEVVVNDHIALRTFGHQRVGIDKLASAFIACGYRQQGKYDFETKKLRAKHYEHDDPALPLVFISELKLELFSKTLQAKVNELIEQLTDEQISCPHFVISGKCWQVSYATYEMLRKESEYAAWLSAFGFRANHFTLLVNALKQIDGLKKLNDVIEQAGYPLNAQGGKIKGSPAVYLEQSSTLADTTQVTFTDGNQTIPACYYEFAKRYPMPNGQLFRGFVTQSADKIFQSTDRR